MVNVSAAAQFLLVTLSGMKAGANQQALKAIASTTPAPTAAALSKGVTGKA